MISEIRTSSEQLNQQKASFDKLILMSYQLPLL